MYLLTTAIRHSETPWQGIDCVCHQFATGASIRLAASWMCSTARAHDSAQDLSFGATRHNADDPFTAVSNRYDAPVGVRKYELVSYECCMLTRLQKPLISTRLQSTDAIRKGLRVRGLCNIFACHLRRDMPPSYGLSRTFEAWA